MVIRCRNQGEPSRVFVRLLQGSGRFRGQDARGYLRQRAAIAASTG